MTGFRSNIAQIDSVTSRVLRDLRGRDHAQRTVPERILRLIEVVQSALRELEQHEDLLCDNAGPEQVPSNTPRGHQQRTTDLSVDPQPITTAAENADKSVANRPFELAGVVPQQVTYGRRKTDQGVGPEVETDLPIGLLFRVSQDEEHTRLRWSDGDHRLDLGERAHHYSLLTLARLRIADAQRGLDHESQGWVEVKELATMLGIDTAHLNIHIHRLRRQFAAVSQCGHALALIERRRGSVRIGAHPMSIWHGAELETSFDPRR